MNTEWKLWSAEQLSGNLTKYALILDSNLGIIPAEYHEKNRALVQSLTSNPPTASEIKDGTRASELVPFAFALDVCGRQAAREGHPFGGLELLQAAHEIFRSVNKSLYPSNQMRQVVDNALRLLFDVNIVRAKDGKIDAGIIRDGLRNFVVSAWGQLPSRLALTIDEMILTGFERVREAQEDDSDFLERFVRDNIEAILGLDIPTRLEKVRKHWEEIGEHIAPNATRMAVRAIHRAEELDTLLSSNVWDEILRSVERGDVLALKSVLEEVEDPLESNLRLRLDAKPEIRQPSAEVRFKGGPDSYFIEARDLLLRRDRKALQKFNNMHYKKSNNPIVKEWYAYALSLFGTAADVHEIIELLENAIASDYFRTDLNWTARWNLACSLRRLPDRASEALDCLLPVLDNDIHTTEVFELCLLWALEQKREGVVTGLLLKSSHHEAHLLAAIYDLDSTPEINAATFQEHFRRISRILRDKNRVFPDPKERLNFDDLDQLTREFVETSLVDAGIEWFRQRVSYGQERMIFKNWECASRLNEEAGDLRAAWRCRQQAWSLTQRNSRVDPRKKGNVFKSLLSWGARHGFEGDLQLILREGWRDAGFTEADLGLWEQRLNKNPASKPATFVSQLKRPSNVSYSADAMALEVPEPEVKLAAFEAEETIQKMAGSFSTVGSVDALAARANDIELLLRSIVVKNPGAAGQALSSIRSIVGLVGKFQKGISEDKTDEWLDELKQHSQVLRARRGELPFEATGLAQACERVFQNAMVRVKAIPDIVITPPSDLRVSFARPLGGQGYSTCVAVRLANSGPEEMKDVQVSFISPSPGVRLSIEPVMTLPLGPGERRIVEAGLEIFHGVEDQVEVRVLVSYEVAGISRRNHANCRIPIVESIIEIPARYITSGPVAVDRTDLFHGRDRELSHLAAIFDGGPMKKLYFVNGIRAVGKSSLMRHLGSRCSSQVLCLLLDVELALGSQGMTASQLVRQLSRLAIREAQAGLKRPELSISLPDLEAFKLDPPWVVFDSFLDELRIRAGFEKLLLCFDELQRLVARVADKEDVMDDGFLGWIRDKIQTPSDTYVICTGSEPFGVLRRRYEFHNVWRNMEPFDVSFVDRFSMEQIATVPVQKDGVEWLPEALDRLWDFTEGHPAVIQIIAEGVVDILNSERRRLVLPSDIDRSSEAVPYDHTAREVWWNEKQGMISSTHRQIAFIILQNQVQARVGLEEDKLAEMAQKAGIRSLGRYLDEMRALEVLTPVPSGASQKWRIKGAFLEQHVMSLLARTLQDAGAKSLTLPNQPLAIMLDLENVKIGLSKLLKQMPESKAEALKPRLQASNLATRLLMAASRHGVPRQRWVVADWDQSFFKGDQKAFKAARYSTDIAGTDKSNSSDHVLREKIHFVLREHPEVNIFVIGTGDADFHETIKTLQEKGKSVVLWSTRDSINRAYGESLQGPDRISVEWLEDIVFSDEAGEIAIAEDAVS